MNKTAYGAFENEKDRHDLPPSSDSESANDDDPSAKEEHRKLLGNRSEEIGSTEDSDKTPDFVSGASGKTDAVSGEGVECCVSETTANY